jgi:hypothetical protein
LKILFGYQNRTFFLLFRTAEKTGFLLLWSEKAKAAVREKWRKMFHCLERREIKKRKIYHFYEVLRKKKNTKNT